MVSKLVFAWFCEWHSILEYSPTRPISTSETADDPLKWVESARGLGYLPLVFTNLALSKSTNSPAHRARPARGLRCLRFLCASGFLAREATDEPLKRVTRVGSSWILIKPFLHLVLSAGETADDLL